MLVDLIHFEENEVCNLHIKPIFKKMELNKIILSEFQHEMNKTKRFFEVISEDEFDFKPHEKSKSLGDLVKHIVPIPSWVNIITEKQLLDWSTELPSKKLTSKVDIIETFNKNIELGTQALSKVSNQELAKIWTMKNGSKIYFSGSKQAALRNLIINHVIHHRAQLGVYLRLNNIMVPASYIASADDSLL